MREIKFRGKRIDNGEWVYGFLANRGLISIGAIQISVEDINSKATAQMRAVIQAYQVDPETVGQYTGLKDRNGKEIYEGDIVRFTRKNVFNAKGLIIGVIEYHPDRLAYIVSNCIVRQPDGEKEKWDYTFLSEDGLEVIGNIYDNPELLED